MFIEEIQEKIIVKNLSFVLIVNTPAGTTEYTISKWEVLPPYKSEEAPDPYTDEIIILVEGVANNGETYSSSIRVTFIELAALFNRANNA